MKRLFERVADLDVHKDMIVACVHVPDAGGGCHQETRSFQTTTRGLLTLLDWLRTRLRGRRGHQEATIAVGHSILAAAWHMLSRDVTHHDLGDAYFIRREAEHADRYRRRLVKQLERVGHKVTLEPLLEAA
jgi:hypothetical protein